MKFEYIFWKVHSSSTLWRWRHKILFAIQKCTHCELQGTFHTGLWEWRDRAALSGISWALLWCSGHRCGEIGPQTPGCRWNFSWYRSLPMWTTILGTSPSPQHLRKEKINRPRSDCYLHPIFPKVNRCLNFQRFLFLFIYYYFFFFFFLGGWSFVSCLTVPVK